MALGDSPVLYHGSGGSVCIPWDDGGASFPPLAHLRAFHHINPDLTEIGKPARQRRRRTPHLGIVNERVHTTGISAWRRKRKPQIPNQVR